MRNLPVKSGLIAYIYFSPENGQLHLQFQSGEVRMFDGVPELEVRAMVESSSPGHYYINNIRKKYRKVAA